MALLFILAILGARGLVLDVQLDADQVVVLDRAHHRRRPQERPGLHEGREQQGEAEWQQHAHSLYFLYFWPAFDFAESLFGPEF